VRRGAGILGLRTPWKQHTALDGKLHPDLHGRSALRRERLYGETGRHVVAVAPVASQKLAVYDLPRHHIPVAVRRTLRVQHRVFGVHHDQAMPVEGPVGRPAQAYVAVPDGRLAVRPDPHLARHKVGGAQEARDESAGRPVIQLLS